MEEAINVVNNLIDKAYNDIQFFGKHFEPGNIYFEQAVNKWILLKQVKKELEKNEKQDTNQ